MYTKRLCWTAVVPQTLIGMLVTVMTLDCAAGTFPAANSQEIKTIKARVRASHFLSKATFGPTQESIEELAGRITQIGYRRACEEWIDEQFALPMSSHEQVARDMVAADGRQINQASIGIHNYRYQAWWHIALTREDQLRQKVAWALSQIFVIGDTGVGFNSERQRDIGNGESTIPQWLGMSNYYDMLAKHASGNYRELLGDVTFHQCMGIWLSSYRNRKADVYNGRWPDENYAREIMQLFSMGLYQLHQDGRLKVNDQGELIPTYDNDGITELARVFTGLKSHHNTSTSFYVANNFGDPMVLDFRHHDNNKNYTEDPDNAGQPDPDAPQSKTLFGVTLSPLPVPLTNQAALDEVNEALDVIANQSSVPPFICRLLIQRLVKSNPSRGYIRRVTRKFRDNGQGVRGDMAAVVKAILLDPEVARGQRLRRVTSPSLAVQVTPRGTEYCRLREPIQRVTSWIRAMRPVSAYPYNSSAQKRDPETGETYMVLGFRFHTNNYEDIDDIIGQMPYRSPSVFNFYLPDYQPPGDLIGHTPSKRIPREALFAPEFQVLTSVIANRMVNEFVNIGRVLYVRGRPRVGQCRIYFNLGEEIELAKNNANLPEILRRFDLWLCNGSLSEETKTSIINAITTESTSASQAQQRLEEALIAVILSPDCAVEE